MTSENARVCWCQCKTLRPFGGGYLHCARCESLVFEKLPDDDLAVINDEDGDLYGRNYYLQHLVKDFGYPDLDTRLRSDLPERCLHWLNTLLKYKKPGAKILELGCGHGASVALFRAAGYDATGLELSPWLVGFAQEKWQIPVLQGPLEQQKIEPGSLDAIVAFDVFEHLIDPQKTANLCASLLKKDGILLIQTPEYPARSSFEELIKQNHPFLTQLKPVEHLHLFSNQAARKLMRNAGLPGFVNEPAIFAHYDQYFVASRKKPAAIEAKEMEESLRKTVPGRLVQAMLDLRAETTRNNDSQSLQYQLAEAQADRVERLRVISRQGEEITSLQKLVRDTEEDRDRWQTRANEAREELGRVLPEFDARLKELAALYERATEVENDRNLARAQLADLQKHFEASEADRAERLKVIETQGEQLSRLQAENALLQGELANLKGHFDLSEADRAERLKVIESQGAQIGELQASIASYLSELEETRDHAKQLEQKIGSLEGIVAATEKERDKWLARAGEAEQRLGELLPDFDARLAELRTQYEKISALENERNLLRSQLDELQRHFDSAEKDRNERLDVIHKQGAQIVELQALINATERERDKWQARASKAEGQLANLLPEFDRRLKELDTQYQRADALQNEVNRLQAQTKELSAHFAASEADRAERLRVIQQQGARIAELEQIIHATERERDKWLARTQQAESELEAKIAQVRALGQQLAESERALAAQRENTRQLEARVAALETDLAETRVQHAAASAASDTANRALSNLLAKVATLRRSRLYTTLRKLGLVPRV